MIILGCGYVGSVLAGELAERMPSAEVTVCDSDPDRIRETCMRTGRGNVHALQLDLSDRVKLGYTLQGFDLAVGLAPGRLGYQTVEASIEAGLDMVDLSYMPEDPLVLDREALKAGVTVVPDCGLAPGLSNMLVGRAVSLLDEVWDVKILVGGLPERPVPPLGYKLTWSVEDLIEEYVRKARIIVDEKTVEVDALEGLEEVCFPGVGRLEAFYTDGVRTLHRTVKGARNLREKTLRYPGHAERVRLLLELGFFDEKPLDIGGIAVAPRSVAKSLFERKLSVPEVRDLVAMEVEVSGVKDGSETRRVYRLLDRYDEEKGMTAMGRMTAYTALAVIQLLADACIKEKGVVAPEMLGMNEELFRAVMTDLARKGVRVSEETAVIRSRA